MSIIVYFSGNMYWCHASSLNAAAVFVSSTSQPAEEKETFESARASDQFENWRASKWTDDDDDDTYGWRSELRAAHLNQPVGVYRASRGAPAASAAVELRREIAAAHPHILDSL